MENEFKKIYEELKNEFGEKYKPLLSDKVGKGAVYMFFTWFIISFITMLLKRVGLEETNLYLIIDSVEKLIIPVLIIIVLYISNKNFEYWGKAFDFKKEVGVQFFNKIDEKVEYKIYRKEINQDEVKKELDNMLSDDVTIVDVEDELIFDNKIWYTIRYDNKDKIRFNGIFVIIKNSKIANENVIEYIKSLDLNISDIIKNAIKKDNKVYVLLDAVENFQFYNKDFFREKELYDNFVRYKEIKKLV